MIQIFVSIKRYGNKMSSNLYFKRKIAIIYLIAGVAGFLLSIVTTTILGEKISHPFSIGFFVVLLCRVLVSAGSIFINYTLNKRKEEDF